jgi:hypothetical protein
MPCIKNAQKPSLVTIPFPFPSMHSWAFITWRSVPLSSRRPLFPFPPPRKLTEFQTPHRTRHSFLWLIKENLFPIAHYFLLNNVPVVPQAVFSIVNGHEKCLKGQCHESFLQIFHDSSFLRSLDNPSASLNFSFFLYKTWCKATLYTQGATSTSVNHIDSKIYRRINNSGNKLPAGISDTTATVADWPPVSMTPTTTNNKGSRNLSNIASLRIAFRQPLKVPTCEFFDRSDFQHFTPKKSLWEGGDFGVRYCFYI